MSKLEKILCVCEKGNVRSVGTRRRLNKRNFTNVIAIGVTNTEKDTLIMLCNWADRILVVEEWLKEYIPTGIEKIESNFTIGPDVYGNPIKATLQDIIGKQLDQLGLK